MSARFANFGSSPLAQGPLLLDGDSRPYVGLIPARAGSTPIGQWFQCQSSAHPRSRGEHQRAPRLRRPFHGSSPLARGTQSSPQLPSQASRLIPAHAGNIGTPQLRNGGRSAHPRSRGEHPLKKVAGAWPFGSSPLARRAPEGTDGRHEMVRLIPARAGNISRLS